MEFYLFLFRLSTFVARKKKLWQKLVPLKISLFLHTKVGLFFLGEQILSDKNSTNLLNTFSLHLHTNTNDHFVDTVFLKSFLHAK